MANGMKDWLESLGLGVYVEVFEKQMITPDLLAELSDADLKELGIDALGARKKILGAIAAGQLPDASVPPAVSNEPHAASGATPFSGTSKDVGSTSDTLAGATQFGGASAGSASGAGELAGATRFSAGAAGQVPGDALGGATRYGGAASSRAASAPPPGATISAASTQFSPSPTTGGAGSLVGQKLRGRYQILSEAGRGAMGVVYRAFDEATKLDVAVKTLLPEHAQNAALMAQMAKEVALAQQVSHPKLLRVHHLETGRSPYLVMEYIDGGTLTEHWEAQQRKMPAEEVRGLLADVLDALSALHGQNLYHRDVKPDNVLVSRSGDVKLSDYGVASTLREQLAGGAQAGTPYYMSPEQLRGERSDARSDVYAVGVMAHQLMLGAFPFAATSLDAVKNWHLSGSRELASLRGLPFGEVFAKALSIDPRERFQSAAEMREALSGAYADAITKGMRVRRRRQGLMALAALALMFVGAGTSYYVLVVAPRAACETARREGTESGWRQYLATYPEGDCAVEAKTFGMLSQMKFAKIPAGSFMMGSPSTETGRYTNEVQHRVRLTRRIELGVTEVTQGQWKAVTGGRNPSRFKECGEDCPVEGVDWHAALAYANALSRAAGLEPCYTLTPSSCADELSDWASGDTICSGASFVGLSCTGYRLPTEAEWEYAYRAGSKTAYHNGDSDSRLGEIAWFKDNSAEKKHAVGQKQPNAWGLYDMSGNVLEWCWDWYGSYPSNATDYMGPVNGDDRVIRGGSWGNDAGFARAAQRISGAPSDRGNNLGFRLTRTVP